MPAGTVLGSTTAAKHAVGFNLSLLKGGTITQTIIGAIITGLVIASTIATIILVSLGVGYSRPKPQPDFATTYKRVPITLDVLLNDKDPRGGNLTLTQIVIPPKFGFVKILSRSKVVYQSIGAYSGNDTFSYEVSNSFVTANATVTVQILNRAPQAVPVYKKISKNAKKALIDIFNYVGENDEKITDVDNDVLYVVSFADQQIVSGKADILGAIEVDSYNGFLYSPANGFNGIEKFNYTISDGNDTSSSTVTVEVDNDAPSAFDDYYRIPKYGGMELNVLANDYDINGDDFNVTGSLGAGYGASRVSSKSVFYYTSSVINKKYSDSFEYTISDGQKEASAVVFIQVYNTEPTVVSKTITIPKSSSNNLILVEYSDPDGKDVITVTKISPALSSLIPAATLQVSKTREARFFTCCEWIQVDTNNYTINFTPTPGVVYTQVLDVTMSDGEAESTGKITLNVVNTPPVAVDDYASCNKNQQVLINVVANDYDENLGDTEKIKLTNVGWSATTTNGGSVSVHNDTHVLYIAPKNTLAADVATYRIFDQSKDSQGNPDATGYSTGKIYISIVNNPPVAVDNVYTISKGLPATLDVLSNDYDPNDGVDSVFTINSVSKSSIKDIVASIVKNSGAKDTLSYVAVNEEYTESLTYDVTDIDGMVSETKATVTLNVINNAPVANDDTYSVNWNKNILCSVKDNDADINGDLEKSTISATQPAHGTTEVIGNTVKYTPNAGYVGQDTFQYQLNDGSAVDSLSNYATVTINVLNTAPIAVDDSATTHWRNDAGVLVNVLTNDSDNEGDSLTVTSANAGSAGTATVVGSQVKFVSTQVSATVGTKQVQYTITDGDKTATANINVVVTNTKPVGVADVYSFHWAAPKQTLNILPNDVDADSDPLTLKSVTGSTAAVKNGNSIDYTPKKDGVTDNFQYVATDTVTDADPTTVTVTFFNNDKPVASSVSTSIHWRDFAAQTNQQEFSVYSATTDADGDSLTLTVDPTATGLSGASCEKTTDAISKVRVKAPTKTLGSATCSFSVSDGLDTTGSKTATVTITNNQPTCSDMTVSFNPTNMASGQSFPIASSVFDSDANDIAYLVPGSAITSGAYPGDSFTVSGANLLFKPVSVGDRDYFYTVTDGVATSTQCKIKIIVSSISVDDYNQNYDVHWNANNFELDVLNKFPGSTLSRIGSVAPQGSASVSGGKVLFTPLRKIYVDTFSAIIVTSGIESTVNIAVTTVNIAPTATVPSQTVNWGKSISIDLLQNYMDADYTASRESKGTVSNIDKTSYVTKGSVSALSGSTVTYTAPSNKYIGADSFKFTATDGLATVTYTVNINIVNTAPVTNTKTFDILWSAHKAGYSVNLAVGVTDAESDTLTYNVISGVSPSSAGSVAMGTSPNAIATASAVPYIGKFSYTYTASDSIATTPGTVEINVLNNVATPIADSVTVHWRSSNVALNPLANFVTNYQDADGDNLTIQTASAQKGTVSIAPGSQTMTYSAKTNPGSLGVDVVSYKFTDGAQSVQNANTVVNVNLINTPPTAINQVASGKWNAPIVVSLANACTDADSNDSLHVTFNGVISNVVGGGYTVSGKTVTYTPNPASLTFVKVGDVYTATGSFKFQCTDGIQDSALGTTTITIVNNAPTGSIQTKSLNRDYTKTTYDFTWSEVIALNTEVDGDVISYQSLSSNDVNVAVSILGTGIGTGIRLTTPRNVLGEKQISFKLFDGLHYSSTTYLFKVTFLNTAPSCTAATLQLNKKAVSNLSTLFQATDSNNDPIEYALTGTVGDLGSLSGNTFTASSVKSGTVSTLGYTATDKQLTSSSCSITITVINRDPVANDATYQVVPSANNLLHTFTYSATDADADTLTYSPVSNTCSSLTTAITISSTGTISFTRKNTALTGTCTMNIKVVDNNTPTAGQDTAVITFVISSTAPVARDDRFQINQGQTIRIYTSKILENDNDEFGSAATLQFVTFSCPDSSYCHREPRLVSVNGVPALEVDSDQATCQADKFRYTMRTSMGTEKSADVFIEFKNCYCAAKIDFVFLYDSSGSIGSPNFDSMRDLGRRITGRMKLAEDAIKVSIVRFHTGGTMTLALTSDGALVNQTFTNMHYDAGWTAQIPGLRVAVDALRPENGGRADAAKVIYILTDGLANIPCSCDECIDEWRTTPSVYKKTVQTDVINSGMTSSQKRNFYRSMCAYKFSDSSGLTGTTCYDCSGYNYAYCLPCADAVPIAKKINSWKKDANGVIPADPDNPYNGNNNVPWKIVAMAVGEAMNNVWGARQIQGMNYDPSRALTVSWTDLSSTMNEIVDQSCNQVNVQVP